MLAKGSTEPFVSAPSHWAEEDVDIAKAVPAVSTLIKEVQLRVLRVGKVIAALGEATLTRGRAKYATERPLELRNFEAKLRIMDVVEKLMVRLNRDMIIVKIYITTIRWSLTHCKHEVEETHIRDKRIPRHGLFRQNSRNLLGINKTAPIRLFRL